MERERNKREMTKLSDLAFLVVLQICQTSVSDLAFRVVLQRKLCAQPTWAENPADFLAMAQTGPTCSSTMPSPARAMWLAGSTTASFPRARPSWASGARWPTGTSSSWTGQDDANARDAGADGCASDVDGDGDADAGGGCRNK